MDWEYAKEGIHLWLNNHPIEAEKHFKLNSSNSIVILAGQTYVSCLNSVISYEMDKIEESQNLLRGLEKKCAGNIGWIKTIKNRFFGSTPTTTITTPQTQPIHINYNNTTTNTIKLLEEQVILADTQLCLAIMTFLTQDFSG